MPPADEPRRVWRDLTRTFLLLAPLLAGLAALVLALALAGCGDDEEVVQVDLSKRVEVNLEQPPGGLTYAYLPQYSHTVSYRRHGPLVDYLAEATGLRLRQVFPDTFDDHISMVGEGAIDISFLNPFAYVKINQRFGATAFARIEEPGSRGFYGEIIARRDNEFISSLLDCRGKRWIAVDPTSAGGYLFPLGHFLEHGLSKSDFAEIDFAPGPGGKQEKVVLAVYYGKFEVGTVRSGTRALLADRIDLDELKVVASTRDYPGWTFAARKGLSASVTQRIRDALLALDRDDPDDRAILERAHFQGVVAARDSDFDPVRDLIKRLESAGEITVGGGQ
ncbi:phosphate/phosphite/phosphonate ABC transporter substrate-binding protein [Desulfohalovibrio reitneri]|uniref:phosphate/phosphite/phosphonate ABC transporter substrate-binding protein n=1 Tax=Desulfohalovibrio reitneri TaxID=1307759 RepID=UPI0009DFE594|nr:phosphate/phosphite/phosphonate ABC transporter substrate-binding protein [Desulfohalovibrio reitneri]